MNFDVIIATYNRQDSLALLVSQILSCTKLPENIIIVDSSDTDNKEIQSIKSIKYIKSNYANQPYQRYLGYLISGSDILVYFDDDMRILDQKCFEKMLVPFHKKNVAGVQPNFSYEHNFFDKRFPGSKTRELAKYNSTFRFFKKISGNPSIEIGKFWLAGLRGAKPLNGNSIEWFNGPIFSARKKYLYNNFNFHLFELYQDGNGKAEDAILGFTISKFGEIVYLEDELFYHDDQDDSVYTIDFDSYGYRIAYSRLYLSFEYARLSGTSKILAFAHFNVYIFGRVIGMLINQLIDYQYSRYRIMIGYFRGFSKAIMDSKKMFSFNKESIWKNNATKNLNTNIHQVKRVKK